MATGISGQRKENLVVRDLLRSKTFELRDIPFTSGMLGAGLRFQTINGSTYAELDNLTIRNTLRTHIFQKDIVKVSNGYLYISDSGVIAADPNGDISTSTTVTFLDEKSASFSPGDILWVKDADPDSGTISSVKMLIQDSGTANTNGTTTYTVSYQEGLYSDLKDGQTAARISGGSILLDASSTYSPFIDVYDDDEIYYWEGSQVVVNASGATCDTGTKWYFVSKSDTDARIDIDINDVESGINLCINGEHITEFSDTVSDVTKTWSVDYITIKQGINVISLYGDGDDGATVEKIVVTGRQKLKARYGKLTGITSPTFGTLKGYGLYSENIYLEGNANIAGTLTAGDGNGVGNTFYAGRIKKNLIKNSTNFTLLPWSGYYGGLVNVEITTAPDGTFTALKGDTQDDDHKNGYLYTDSDLITSLIGKEVTASVWVKTFNNRVIARIGFHDSLTQSYYIDPGIWVRISYTNTFSENENEPGRLFQFTIDEDDEEVAFWGPQLEFGNAPTLYQPTDNAVAADNGYGMWAINGGFGGTIQNPSLKLDSYGLLVKDTGNSITTSSNGTYIGNYAVGTGFYGTILNEDGLYGYVNGAEAFHIDTTDAKIAGWSIDDNSIYNQVSSTAYISLGYPQAWTSGWYGLQVGTDSSNRIWMATFNNDNTNAYEVGAVYNGAYTFRLGNNENSIAGWNFDSSKLYKTIGTSSINIGSSSIDASTGFILVDNTDGVIEAVFDGSGNSRLEVRNSDYTDVFFAGLAGNYGNTAENMAVIIKSNNETIFTAGATIGNVFAGWSFDTAKLYNGTDIVLDAANKKVSVYNDAVKMYYASSTDYGIKDSAGKFSLGYTNKIAGWSFNNTELTGSNARLRSSGVLSLGSADGWAIADSIYIDGANSRMSIGSGFTYTAGLLSITGSAKIGNWSITSTAIYKGSTIFGTAGTGNMYLGDSGISISDTFKVTSAGALTSTSGSIASWSIGSTTLTGGNIKLTSSGSIENTTGAWKLNNDGSGSLAYGKLYFDEYGFTIEDAQLKVSSTGIRTDAYDGLNMKYVIFRAATVYYGTLEPNTTISIISSSGTVKKTITVVKAYSNGTISSTDVEAGDIIEGDKPLSIVTHGAFGGNYALMGTLFFTYTSRYQPHNFYIYSPYGDATVKIYETTTNGDYSTVTQTLTASKGSVTISQDFVNDIAYFKIESNFPIILFKYSTSGDYVIIPPAANEILYYADDTIPKSSTTQTVTEVGSHYRKSNLPFSVIQIGDGSGGDADHGTPLQFLGDTYFIPHSVNGYQIVAVEPTIINVYKSDNDGNLTLYETVDASNASKSSVFYHTVGSESTGGSDINSYGMYFEGTGNFYLRTQNPGDDEYFLLGYRKKQRNVYDFSTVISGNRIRTGVIQSNNWSTTAGSQLDLDAGTIKLGGSSDPKFSVASDGTLTASEAEISGAITATSGYIGGTTGWSINTGLIKSLDASSNGIEIDAVNKTINIKNADTITTSVAYTADNNGWGLEAQPDGVATNISLAYTDWTASSKTAVLQDDGGGHVEVTDTGDYKGYIESSAVLDTNLKFYTATVYNSSTYEASVAIAINDEIVTSYVNVAPSSSATLTFSYKASADDNIRVYYNYYQLDKTYQVDLSVTALYYQSYAASSHLTQNGLFISNDPENYIKIGSGVAEFKGDILFSINKAHIGFLESGYINGQDIRTGSITVDEYVDLHTAYIKQRDAKDPDYGDGIGGYYLKVSGANGSDGVSDGNGGNGGDLLFAAGNGGNATGLGYTNGNGGNIYIAPGIPGDATADAGTNGNIYLNYDGSSTIGNTYSLGTMYLKGVKTYDSVSSTYETGYTGTITFVDGDGADVSIYVVNGIITGWDG